MASEHELVVALDQSIARQMAAIAELDRQLQEQAALALEDWLLVEACKDYDTIDLDPDVTSKAHRKIFKTLREKKRNVEKILVALQALRETAATADGEKLRKKFSTEMEKYE